MKFIRICRGVEKKVGNGGEDAVSWVRERLGFAPDEAQARLLGSRSSRGILNCTRQWGKSTIAAAKAVHQAMTAAGSLSLVVSPSARQSGEFLRKAEEFVMRLGMRPKGDGENTLSVAFPNGSRIVGLPGNEATVRGFSAVALLLVDEASRVSDTLYQAIRPMLAVSRGALWLMSTPNGPRGFFYETWMKGGADWTRVRVPATECPRIGADHLEEERVWLGDRGFRQEYLCEFVAMEGAVFDRAMVEQAVRYDFKPLEFR